MALTDYASGWFSRGNITFTSGANAGSTFEVKQHGMSAASVGVELWTAPSQPFATGDAFTIDAGCDKHLATCRDKFANVANHRGFPHLPGNEFVTGYPSADDGNNDGGSRYI